MCTFELTQTSNVLTSLCFIYQILFEGNVQARYKPVGQLDQQKQTKNNPQTNQPTNKKVLKPNVKSING